MRIRINIKFLLTSICCCLWLFCGTGAALGAVVSAQASRGFKGQISRNMATQVAAADAKLQAAQLAMRELAQKDEIKLFLGGDVMRAAPRPVPIALALALLEVEEIKSFVDGVPPDMQVLVTVNLTVASDQSNMGTLHLLLAQPELLELYARAIVLLQETLEGYDAASAPFLLPSLPEKQQRQLLEQAEGALFAAYARVEAAMSYLAALPALHPADLAGNVAGNSAELLELLEVAAKKAPDSYLILTDLARLRLFYGHLLAAKEALDAAIGLEPSFAFAYDLRGLVLLWQELPALALLDFNHAIQLEPYYPVFFENRALAYKILEQPAAMCADFTESCRLGECGGLEWAKEEGFCVKP